MTQATAATGFLLRSVAHGEADTVTTWFTRELGKVSAFAKASRGSRRRFSGALSQLTVARLDLVPSRGVLWRLERAEVVTSFMELASDLHAVAYAAYACELVGALTMPDHPEPALFDDLFALHEALGRGEVSPFALRWYELRLLDAIGSLPDRQDLVAWGRSGPLHALSDGARVGQLDAVEALLAELLAAPSLADAGALVAADEVAIAVRDLLSTLIGGLIDRPLQSLAFLQKLNAGLRRHRPSRPPVP